MSQPGGADEYKTAGGVLSASYAFSPTVVNEDLFGAKGHHRYVADYDQDRLNSLTRSQLGINIPQFHPEINPLNLIPGMTFGGVPGAASMSWDGRFPLVAMYQDYSVVDGFTKVLRSHTIKAGLDLEAIYTKNGDNGTFAISLTSAGREQPARFERAYEAGCCGASPARNRRRASPIRLRQKLRMVRAGWLEGEQELTLDYGIRFSVRWPD
jgi:hypothetical protein